MVKENNSNREGSDSILRHVFQTTLRYYMEISDEDVCIDGSVETSGCECDSFIVIKPHSQVNQTNYGIPKLGRKCGICLRKTLFAKYYNIASFYQFYSAEIE